MSAYNSGPISQLQPDSAVLGTDVLPATDVTDLTQSPSGTTKKYTMNQVLSFVQNTIVSNDVQTAKYATTGNLVAVYLNGVQGLNDGIGATLTNSGLFAALTVDGFAVSVGDRILVSFQTDPVQNGVYVVTNTGSVATNWVLTRATDFDGSAFGEIRQGDFIAVLFGNSNALSWWFLTSVTPVIVGTDAIVFQKQVNVVSESWVNQTTTPVTMAINTGYTSAGGATTIDFALPLSAPVGAWLEINGQGSGLFTVSQAAGQVIHDGSASTTVGVAGFLASTVVHTAIKMRCIVADLEFEVVSSSGSFNIN